MARKKKSRPARTRDWSDKHEDAFTHDRTKHLKAQAIVPSFTPTLAPEAANAVVVSHSGQWAFVKMAGKEQLCLIDPGLFEGESSILATGDQVLVEFKEEEPIVRAVAPRRTKLSRLAHVHSRLTEQVIAANIDALVIVASAVKPRFKPGLVDRYLIIAEVGGVAPLLVINKMDLVDREPEKVQPYRELGLPVVNTSCVTGLGIDTFRETLRGKLSVLGGHSGVGKSSLLNAMDPSLDIATKEVSASTEKGRHSTPVSRLYELRGDVHVIDTPGIRQLGLRGVSSQELAYYFPEMETLASQCRYRNCTHTHEPQCAVREAVEAGEVPKLRYESYKRILENLS